MHARYSQPSRPPPPPGCRGRCQRLGSLGWRHSLREAIYLWTRPPYSRCERGCGKQTLRAGATTRIEPRTRDCLDRAVHRLRREPPIWPRATGSIPGRLSRSSNHRRAPQAASAVQSRCLTAGMNRYSAHTEPRPPRGPPREPPRGWVPFALPRAALLRGVRSHPSNFSRHDLIPPQLQIPACGPMTPRFTPQPSLPSSHLPTSRLQQQRPQLRHRA